jgi:hypothetical protein
MRMQELHKLALDLGYEFGGQGRYFDEKIRNKTISC